MKRIVFVDRDGTLIREPEDRQVDALEKLKLIDHVIPCLLALIQGGYQLVMITNQDQLGTQAFPQHRFYIVHHALLQIFHSQGITFERVLICPHAPESHCDCRKPRVGLVMDYLQNTTIDWPHCHVVGDRLSDLQLAQNIRATGWLVHGPLNPQDHSSHSWPHITRAILTQPRTARTTRTTRETSITVEVNLDQPAPPTISTGIPFFNHMLEQIGYHGQFFCHIKAQGDLEVDLHHTIEDTAIVLGETLRVALGDRKGLTRYGFSLPMDEASCHVLIDLVQRPYFLLQGQFPSSPPISGIDGQMFAHFFRSLCFALQCNLHLRVQGENPHHMVESAFKCFARALHQALRKPQCPGHVLLTDNTTTSHTYAASSKGTL